MLHRLIRWRSISYPSLLMVKPFAPFSALSSSRPAALVKSKHLEENVVVPAVDATTSYQAAEFEMYSKALQHDDYFGVRPLVSIPQLFNARVHLGHKMGTLTTEMKEYIYGERLGVCIFDLNQTAEHLRSALNFIAHIAYREGIILFVTNHRESMHLVERTAKECGEYSHVRKWRVGLLTDSTAVFQTDIRQPDLIIMTHTQNSVFEMHPAIVEVSKMLIPIVGIVDSNSSPNLITYPIPGNDDSIASIQLYLQLFKAAIVLGKQKRKEDLLQIQKP